MKSLTNIIMGILIGLVAAGIIWVTASKPRGAAITILPSSTPGLVTVYVSGGVANPGLYSLPIGSRIDAAIQAAGGFIPGAEPQSINLAELLEDGQQIDVPGIIRTSHINAGRVNINTATVSELDELPGMGPTTAQAIVDYRLQHGQFQLIQDILNVPGVGPATYEKIKDYISVNP